jgi:hypothetical protein
MGKLLEMSSGTGELVETLAGQGVEVEQIALMAGLRSVKALRRQFGRQLELGPVKANHAVANSLFELATKGKNGPAMMFWLKCRAKWNMNPGSGWEDEDVEVVFGTCKRLED